MGGPAFGLTSSLVICNHLAVKLSLLFSLLLVKVHWQTPSDCALGCVVSCIESQFTLSPVTRAPNKGADTVQR